MNRFHVHVHVDALARNIDFYSKMFGVEPTRTASDHTDLQRITWSYANLGRPRHSQCWLMLHRQAPHRTDAFTA